MTLVPQPAGSPTSLEEAQKNSLASANVQRELRNATLRFNYEGAFNSFVEGVRARPTFYNLADAPKPPKGFTVRTDADGWAYVTLGDNPVCDALPIPPDVTNALNPVVVPDMNIDIGASADGGNGFWFTAGPQDSYPSGKKTPPMPGPPDGNVHTYLKVGGVAAGGKNVGGVTHGGGWYERLS